MTENAVVIVAQVGQNVMEIVTEEENKQVQS